MQPQQSVDALHDDRNELDDVNSSKIEADTIERSGASPSRHGAVSDATRKRGAQLGLGEAAGRRVLGGPEPAIHGGRCLRADITLREGARVEISDQKRSSRCRATVFSMDSPFSLIALASSSILPTAFDRMPAASSSV